MKKIQLTTQKLCIIAMVSTMIACVDDKYDLGKNVDIKLGISENGITLPTSSTSDIKLSQVMELEENGQLKTDAAGNYYFHKTGTTTNETIISVGYGSICNTAETNYTFYFKKDPTLETSVRYPEYNINTMKFTVKVQPPYAPDKLGQHVRELCYVHTPMDIVIEFLDNNIADFAPYISEIRYTVPSYYDIEDESDLTQKNVKTNTFNYHRIRCKGVDFKAALKNGEVASYNNKTGQITFKGEIKMECAIDYAYMNEYKKIEDPFIQMRTTIGSLTTDKVEGRFEKSEYVEVEPITFENLPDMINDEEVVIDIENPVVRLTVDNEVPARALINATLKAYRDGKETASLKIGEAYGTDSIKFEGGMKQTVWVSRIPTAIPDTVNGNVVIPEMMNLLKVMPDKIEIDGWAHTDSSQVVTMGLNKKYHVYPTYELFAPLVMGKNMKLVYTKTMDDLHDKLKKLEVNKITFTTNATSNIPLDLTATMKAMDQQGNPIENIRLEQSQTIEGLAESKITLTLTGNTDDFQKMYSVELKAYAECNETMAGQPLNENQAIRFDNIRVTAY